MATQSERVHVMQENFMMLHSKGYSIPEIAEKYNLSFSTVYAHLEEIAQANGVERKDLLQRVFPTRSENTIKVEIAKTKATFKEIKEGLEEAEDLIEEGIKNIDAILKEN